MTTQEFFSTKKFKKDLRKFNILKRTLKSNEMDYERETDRCSEILQTFSMNTSKANILDDGALFYEHDRNTTKKIEILRSTFHK
jgi:hypothetical protein